MTCMVHYLDDLPLVCKGNTFFGLLFPHFHVHYFSTLYNNGCQKRGPRNIQRVYGHISNSNANKLD